MKTETQIRCRLTQLERDRRTASEYRKALQEIDAKTLTEAVNRDIGITKTEDTLDLLNEKIALLEWVLK